jgi:hypothetical protein
LMWTRCGPTIAAYCASTFPTATFCSGEVLRRHSWPRSIFDESRAWLSSSISTLEYYFSCKPYSCIADDVSAFETTIKPSSMLGLCTCAYAGSGGGHKH